MQICGSRHYAPDDLSDFLVKENSQRWHCAMQTTLMPLTH
jgi:hypothetical protein